MTRWVAYPLRQPGKSWPGTDKKGGKLDDGRGLLTENSVNVTINQSDTLSKRKGFVRGLDERFGSVVCGLHAYTDNCGREWLLVADDTGISIRQPFVIPVFQTDDSYPSDSFDDVAGLSDALWRNTSLYTATGGSLLRVSGGGRSQPFLAADYLRWFKSAASSSYSVQIEYAFADSATLSQVVSIAIKGNGDLTTGAYLHADLLFKSPLYVAKLYHVSASGTQTPIGQIDVLGRLTNPSGFFTLTYQRLLINNVMTFVPSMEVVPVGGGPQVVSASLTDIQDRDLGQVSAIGCSLDAAILVVSGGAV